MLQAWLVYQNEVPMGATNWHRNQGSEAFSFLTGGLCYGCIDKTILVLPPLPIFL